MPEPDQTAYVELLEAKVAALVGFQDRMLLLLERTFTEDRAGFELATRVLAGQDDLDDFSLYDAFLRVLDERDDLIFGRSTL